MQRVAILCGGRGVRAYPATATVPKPLLRVGDKPLVQHVMEIYARHGFTDFVLAVGHSKPAFDAFVEDVDPGWKVEVVDTGEDANKGERVLAIADRMTDTFLLTYADGLGNVDIRATLAFHAARTRLATMTTVPLPAQYGVVDVAADGEVQRFRERPRLSDYSINAGFFVFERRCLDLWPAPEADLETDVLPALAAAGQLSAYHHTGNWKSLDSQKDAIELNALCRGDASPWHRATSP